MPAVSVSIPGDKLEQVFAVAFAPVVALSELIKNASDSCYIKKDTIKIYIEEDQARIRIVDNGYGFSLDDISKLGVVTTSTKMSSSNKRSRIGEPYAGSKGQGIFTAFNLCTDLEIKTFSHADNTSYHLKWEDGTALITYDKVSDNFKGTELVLKGVNEESFKVIKGYGEPQKLISSTILYYQDSETLPNIELYLNGDLLPPEIDHKIEDFYNKHNTKKAGLTGFFIAKASFSYKNHMLKISYQDNESDTFNFEDISLDLSSDRALKDFVRAKGITLAKAKEVYESLEDFSEVELDSFSGAFYVWYNRSIPELTYQYGVRVYINNYGLYNFLNKDDDWLGLSQISQGRKASSYKLKNTYGYVHFNEFDENFSALKISNDRNSFLGILTTKKFEFLMKNVITNIFSSLDIEMRRRKQDPSVVFEDQTNTPTLYAGEPFGYKKLIKVSPHLSLYDFDVQCESHEVKINKDTEEITVTKTGNYQIVFIYQDRTINKNFDVSQRKPEFELVKRPPPIIEGNSFDLHKLINKSSRKNLINDEIKITSDDAIIQKDANLSPKTSHGDYKFYFKASKYGIDIVRDITLSVKQASSRDSERLKRKFSKTDKYPKINDVIKGISENYTFNPTFAAIAIRPLVEISLKAFAFEFYSDEEIKKMNRDQANFNPEARIGALINKLKSGAINVDGRILNTHGLSLQKSQKKVVKAYKDIEPNDNIHALQSATTGKHVFDTMSVLSVLINFIIESINLKSATD